MSDATDAGKDAPAAQALPRARVEDAPRFSLIWIVPVLAAVLAAVLGWQAWGERGAPVVIRLEHGHGLKAGHTMRHLGIVVGEVTAVRLDPSAGGVRVEVALDPDAEHLARVGSRFWVVRPQVGLSSIEGLDTLIGSRYLAVLPGDGAPQREFVGLPEPPIPVALQPGLDIRLEGASRGGLHRGSPVTYRRIQVGAVLGVGLASDGRTVEVSVRISAPYADLVRDGTRFWDTSGLHLDLGLTGVDVHLDTLTSLLRGGISLATPPDAGDPVRTGHRFVLHPRPDDDWLEWKPALAVGHSLLPPGAPMPRPQRAALSWTEGRFWSGEERREGWVLGVGGSLLGPADLLEPDEDAHEGSAALEVAGAVLTEAVDTTAVVGGLALRPLPADVAVPSWPRDRQRRPDGPEDALLVADPGEEPYSLAAGRFTADADAWAIDEAVSIDERWHGACVVARTDGRLIGQLLVDDDGARMVPLPHAMP